MRYPRSVKQLTKTELSTLTTERLLAYRKKVLALEHSRDLSDWSEAQIAEVPAGHVCFKEGQAWTTLYQEVKNEPLNASTSSTLLPAADCHES